MRDRLEICLCLCKRSRRLESSYHGDGMPTAASLRSLRHKRHPNHAVACRKTKRCGKNANNLSCLTIHENRLLKNLWICIESRLPKIFPDYCNTVPSISSLGCVE